MIAGIVCTSIEFDWFKAGGVALSIVMALPVVELLLVACTRISAGGGLLFTATGSEWGSGAFAGHPPATAGGPRVTTAAREALSFVRFGRGDGADSKETGDPALDAT